MGGVDFTGIYMPCSFKSGGGYVIMGIIRILSLIFSEVVCRQMGFPNGIASCCNAYGSTRLKPMITNVTCNGTERSLDQCTQDSIVGEESCNYASAICLNVTTLPTGRQRLYSVD